MRSRTQARCSHLATAIFAALACAPAATFAQTAPQSETTELDKITVTGSRIPRQGFVTPSPVVAITAEEIRTTGAVTIGDLMNEMPQLATTFSLVNSSRFVGTVGLNLLDLRGLGTDRTLVLVNGRRHVGGTPGSGAVDVNTIPVEWIERVEVITGGASAVYGADAVAGVVNFVLRDSFDGVTMRGQTGISDEGSFKRSFGSITAGTQFAEGQGNVGVSVEYSTQDRFRFSDRAIGRTSYRTIQNPNYDPSRPAGPDNYQSLLLPNAGLNSFTEGGIFYDGDDNPYVLTAGGKFRPQDFGTVNDPNGCQDCDYLNLNRVADLQPGFDRGSINTIVNFDFNENHRFFFEGKYAQTKSKYLGQPAFSSPIPYSITRDNPYLSSELRDFIDQSGSYALEWDQDTNVVGTPPGIYVYRFDTDAGQRGEDVTRDTMRAVIGFEGSLSPDWTYEVSLVHGKTKERRINVNNRITERFYAGLDAVIDPASGQIVCRSSIDPTSINPHTGLPVTPFGANGCVPFSILGDGAVSDEARAWFNANTVSKGRLSQTVFSGSVSNSALFTLPAGGVGFSAGAEYRRERSRTQADELSNAGLTFLNAIPSEGGEYSVKEVFTEFSVPLLADLPGVDSLIFDLAGRYSDYDTIGSTTTWRAGLDWTVVPSVRLRGTYSKAVRAPNIGELYGAQSENFFTISDPCDSRPGRGISTAGDPALRAANCAALGIPANYISTVQSTRPGLSGGNPDLAQEEGKTLSAGLVFTPDFIPGFGVTLDYWRVSLTDAISSVSGQQVANRCVDSPSGINNRFCDQIDRAGASGGGGFPAYEIAFVRALLENVSKLERSGVDVEMSYRKPWGPGQFDMRFVGTRMLRARTFAFQDDPGEFIEDVTTIGTPRWRANLSTTYRIQNGFRASWELRYVDSMLRVAKESYNTNPFQRNEIRTGSMAYSDFQFGYEVPGTGWDIYLGIDNAFDRSPPRGLFGDTAESALFDNIGRYYYAGFNYKFK